ncbi:MAG: hypothetical protein AB198_02045 [Parcubacteria bacterium C7867-003]|nr:MAG: hypothetical protein AB198_02045 [Parcubacteria bacterium C7867-003]
MISQCFFVKIIKTKKVHNLWRRSVKLEPKPRKNLKIPLKLTKFIKISKPLNPLDETLTNKKSTHFCADFLPLI